MSVVIKEMRLNTGMTQREFAESLGIPLSTLRKWEQGEASPPKYVIELIAGKLPAVNASLLTINGRDGKTYYYDKVRRQLSDSAGNRISVKSDIEEVKSRNLELYVSDLFRAFYEIRDRFERDCYYDKKEDIIWI